MFSATKKTKLNKRYIYRIIFISYLHTVSESVLEIYVFFTFLTNFFS